MVQIGTIADIHAVNDVVAAGGCRTAVAAVDLASRADERSLRASTHNAFAGFIVKMAAVTVFAGFDQVVAAYGCSSARRSIEIGAIRCAF